MSQGTVVTFSGAVNTLITTYNKFSDDSVLL